MIFFTIISIFYNYALVKNLKTIFLHTSSYLKLFLRSCHERTFTWSFKPFQKNSTLTIQKSMYSDNQQYVNQKFVKIFILISK